MFKDKLELFYNESILNKKYIFFYLIFIVAAFFSMMSLKNYAAPKLEILVFAVVAILGIFLINYYSLNSKKNLFKVVFIAILCFGLICSSLMPLFDACDEEEHFERAFLTSQGDFFPNYQNSSFNSIQSVLLLIDNRPATVFDTNVDTQPINYTSTHYHSAFQQNPFFGYLAQGLGILLAEILSLNQIWMLWLARAFNVLLYAALAAYAVKKTPIGKHLFFVMAAVPLAIYQISSVSIDATIFGLALVAVAYLFSLIKSSEKVTPKQIAVYTLLCLLLGLCKVTYFAFIFLVLLIPRDNFEINKQYLFGILAVAVLAVVALLWSKYYATPAIVHSYRMDYMAQHNINAASQVQYLISHPSQFVIAINFALNNLGYIFSSLFTFSYPHEGHMHNSDFMSPMYQLFLGALIFLYPLKEKFSRNFRIGALAVAVLVYIGTFVIQLLTWTPVGSIYTEGIQARYFLPLFILLPFIFNFNDNLGLDTEKIDNYIVVLVLGFVAATVLCLVCGCY